MDSQPRVCTGLATISNDICSLALAAAEIVAGFAVFCRFLIRRWIFLGLKCQKVAQRFMSGIHVDADVSLQIAAIQHAARQKAKFI